ncbi:MAG: GNAT family N-acetyltransferase [Phycisphaerae bacterium]|nr:GNAT family N-acetyltransferase [Phycisphaerae bacterium]
MSNTDAEHARTHTRPGALARPVRAEDSMADLTILLHRAYRKQVEMGLRPLAGRQTEDITRARIHSGEAFVAELRGRLVGMILLNEKEDAAFPPHFQKPGVSHFSLFAVDPECQGQGIGRALLDAAETRARILGFNDFALSMAEPDQELLNFYLRLGFRFVEHWQWPYTNYRSVILTRPIGPPEHAPTDPHRR